LTIKKIRLAIVTTHPIQYNAPLFRLLAKEPAIELKVFYTWSQSQHGAKYDRDFGKMIEWDIPLLDGYQFEFVNNLSKDPGVHHFNGIRNPDLNIIVRAWKPDFLLVIGWNFRSHLSCMRYFKGRIPILFKGDSTLLDERPGIRKILRRVFLSWVYRKVDYALYVGKNNRDYFYQHGLMDNQLSWVPAAIDNERFYGPKDYEEKAKQWRKELGITDNDLVILFAGKLEPKKDPDFILRLAQNIQYPGLKFVIVGNGKMEDELKIKASGDNRIIFLDFQNQQKMPLVYRLGDIFVLPSVGPGETWGLAVNEAMACKRPVIVSDKCGCAPDLVDEKITGWIFEPGEHGEWKIKELIQKILGDRTILDNMGIQAWHKLQPYSYPVAIEKIRQLLGNVPAASESKISQTNPEWL
jgi:glycosyltransferase involved in cell wall biosynthesis